MSRISVSNPLYVDLYIIYEYSDYGQGQVIMFVACTVPRMINYHIIYVIILGEYTYMYNYYTKPAKQVYMFSHQKSVS